MKNIKPARVLVFFVSVFSLSKFFEAGRLIAENQTFTYVGVSIIAGLVFVLSLLVMGLWVYAEEKERNNLKIKLGLYEWLYGKFIAGKIQK